MILLDELPKGYVTGPLKFDIKGIPTHEECRSLIAKLAYQYWLDDGCPHGKDQEHWLKAEQCLFLFNPYHIYVVDASKETTSGFYESWSTKLVFSNDIIADTPKSLDIWAKWEKYKKPKTISV